MSAFATQGGHKKKKQDKNKKKQDKNKKDRMCYAGWP